MYSGKTLVLLWTNEKGSGADTPNFLVGTTQSMSAKFFIFCAHGWGSMSIQEIEQSAQEWFKSLVCQEKDLNIFEKKKKRINSGIRLVVTVGNVGKCFLLFHITHGFHMLGLLWSTGF